MIFSPLIVISLLYFLFLSKPELFSGSFERYKYQDYSFSFKEVVTNKNPLYPELIFEDVVLKIATHVFSKYLILYSMDFPTCGDMAKNMLPCFGTRI